MTLSVEQQTALEAPVVREIYFVEFAFKSGTERACSLNVNFEWNGYTWLGLGGLASISEIEESEGATAKPLHFTLNAAQLEWLSLAAGDVEEYRGRQAKVWMCPLNEGFQLIGEPEIHWRGIMQTVAVSVEGEEGSITLQCETEAFGFKRKTTTRINAEQHKVKHPTDTGLDHLRNIIGHPTVWLSKEFQKR